VLLRRLAEDGQPRDPRLVAAPVVDHDEIGLRQQPLQNRFRAAVEDPGDRLVRQRVVEPFEQDAPAGQQPVHHLAAWHVAHVEDDAGAAGRDEERAVANAGKAWADMHAADPGNDAERHECPSERAQIPH
jgi:hypothetical protein